jgi:hypothetical protein
LEGKLLWVPHSSYDALYPSRINSARTAVEVQIKTTEDKPAAGLNVSQITQRH